MTAKISKKPGHFECFCGHVTEKEDFPRDLPLCEHIMVEYSPHPVWSQCLRCGKVAPSVDKATMRHIGADPKNNRICYGRVVYYGQPAIHRPCGQRLVWIEEPAEPDQE